MRLTSASAALAVLLALLPGAATALDTTTAAATDGKVVHFTSPSGRIDCYLSDDKSFGRGANCIVQQDRWTNRKTRPASCDLDWEPAEVLLTPKGKLRIGACRGDIGPICGPRGTVDACTTLAYGKRVRAGEITCSSSRKGITCRTTTGAGFRVARSGYVTF
ncbi:MAG: DUF6636 domain-containing protein [Sporichthyaceae bacterium]